MKTAKQMKKEARERFRKIIRKHWAFIAIEYAERNKDDVLRETIYWEDKKSPCEGEYVKELLSELAKEIKNQ